MLSKRTRNVYDPKSKEPFRLSRSRIENFLRCARCFYLDRRLGVDRPSTLPFNLNSAVDLLLKKEFDVHRAAGSPHPLMAAYGLEAIPFAHEMMDEWRENFKGVQYHHAPTNLIITGAVDDIWKNERTGELHVVDYKATSKEGEVGIDAEWQEGYRNQMEVYQWLLRRNGFSVSDTGYFVYVNGRRDREAFDGRIECTVKIIPYIGSDDWIEPALREIHACLASDAIPEPSTGCEFCAYRRLAHKVEEQ